MKLSARDNTLELRKELLDLRMKRNKLEDSIDDLNSALTTASPERKDSLMMSLKNLQIEHSDVVRDIQQDEDREDSIDPSRIARREREKREIQMIGFTLVEHGERQYNSRFDPPKDRWSLLKMLSDSGLASKITNHRHHIIKISDNFWVAVEDYKVLTFRYDMWYYKKYKGNPPKFDLRTVKQ